jgi:hypothetical protein
VRGLRLSHAWLVSAAAMAPTLLFLFGFRDQIPSSHRNVAWTALVLSSVTAAVSFRIAHRLRRSAESQPTDLLERAWRLFPVHVGVLIVFGAVDVLILGFLFLGNIH